MAFNRKINFGGDEDELELLRDKYGDLKREFGKVKADSEEVARAYEDLKREKAALLKQIAALQDKARGGSKAQFKDGVAPRKSSIFLIIAAMIVASWLVLYAVVERWGTRDGNFGTCLNVLFALGVLLMIIMWAIHECRSVGWLVAPNLIFLLVSGCIGAAAFDPVWVETGVAGPIEHPAVAAMAIIACLLLAATRLGFLTTGWLLLLVTDPKRYFKQ